ncbi:MAG: MBL fold metallo-hydrolase [Thermoleophilaceae bacterium]|nr:MBL fold metallo-hydrolase [Thermoleophilaceae bacterium]
MRVRRLGWAGVEIEHGGSRLAIDHIGTLGFFEEFWGDEEFRDQLVQLEPGSLDAALITHLHRDHTDPEALAAALEPGAPVAGPEKLRFYSPLQDFAVGQVEKGLVEAGIERQTFSPGESIEVGELTAIACPSVDGVGANQISWLVKAGDESVLHCGDTVWHGYWWDITTEYGAPDVVCLPGNGVEIDFLINKPPVDQPVDLTPEQAVDAAYALGADRLMPIHFTRTYDHEQMYRPIKDAEARIRAAAEDRGVELVFPGIGEWIEVSAAKVLA